MYTHVIKNSKQKCFMSVWWPSKCAYTIAREKSHPMVTTELNGSMRVRKDNLRKITDKDK